MARVSRPRMFLLFVVTIAATLAGLWITGLIVEPPKSARPITTVTVIIGLLCAFLFGTCAFLMLRRFLDPGDQLKISQHGIYWKQWSDVTIPWPEIVDVSTWSYKGQKSIILTLRDRAKFPSERLLGKISAANRALTGGDIPISMTGLNRRFVEAWEAIDTFRSAYAIERVAESSF